MACSKQDIRGWLEGGKNDGRGFMIVVVDGFDHEDYPVYCDAADVHEEHAKVNGKNMQRVMEVYDLNADLEEQLAEHRAMRLPA